MAAAQRGRLSRGRKLGLGVVACVLFAGGLYLGVQVAKPPPPPDFAELIAESEPAPKPVTPPRTDTDSASTHDSLPPDTAPAADSTPDRLRQPPPGPAGAPRIALVIDDLGRSVRDVDRLAALGIPITFSVLPFEVHTPEVVSALRRRGFEYLCHLPMEAKGSADPGPGALGLAMSPEELRAATERALTAVPGAVGVNNHMGSAVMSDRRATTEILSLLAGRDLFFVDSRTSADTLGYTLARSLGVPAAERQVFLDTKPDQASVRAQWQELLASARERGAALAIAHPHDNTLAVLSEAVPAARLAGYEFVTASNLVER